MAPRTASELRRAWTEFFAARQHTIVPSGSLIPTHPTRAHVHQLGDDAVRPLLPRRGGGAVQPRAGRRRCSAAYGPAASTTTSTPSAGRPGTSASSRCWATSASATTSSPRPSPGPGSSSPRCSGSTATASGSPSTRATTRPRTCGPTRSASPASASSASARTTSGRWARPARAARRSEIFWDYGPDVGPEGGPANPAAEDRYVEIWNLVFPQYLRGADGQLSDLPSKNIDTGAGLERMLAVLAGSPSLYAADTLSALVDEAQSVTGSPPRRVRARRHRAAADGRPRPHHDVPRGRRRHPVERGPRLRAAAHHPPRHPLRLPAGRRAAGAAGDGRAHDRRHGRRLPRGGRAAASWSCPSSPARRSRSGARWRPGSQILDTQLDKLEPGGTLPGGGRVPAPRHLRVPVRGHPGDRRPARLRGRRGRLRRRRWTTSAVAARAASKAGGVATGDEVTEQQRILAEHGPTEFTGRDEYETPGHGRRHRRRRPLPRPHALLRRVGRPGRRHRPHRHAHGHRRRRRHDLRAARAAPPHVRRCARARSRSARRPTPASTASGATPSAATTPAPTSSTGRCARCSATTSSSRARSSAPDRLRFDFSHFEPVTPDQIRAIEDLANREILDNAPVRHFETTMNEARELGAIAFFGDKYGDDRAGARGRARTRSSCAAAPTSARLGDIGPVKIVSEGSIGSNLRRLEAVTGFGPIDRLRQEEELVARAADALGTTGRRAAAGGREAARRAEGRSATRSRTLRRQAAGQPGRRAGGRRGRRHRRGPGRRHRPRRGARPGRRGAPAARHPGRGDRRRARGRRRGARGGRHEGQRPRRQGPDRRRGPHGRWRRWGQEPRAGGGRRAAIRRASTRRSTRRGRPPSRRDRLGRTGGTPFAAAGT